MNFPDATAGTDIAARLVIDIGVKSFVLFGSGLLAVLFLSRASAAARHLVLVCIMGGALLLPIFSVILPAWRILPKWGNLPQNSTRKLPPSEPRLFVGETKLNRVNTFNKIVSSEGTSPLPRETFARPREPLSRTTRWSAAQILIGIWIFGAVLCYVRIAAGLVIVRNIERSSSAWRGRGHSTEAETAGEKLNYRRPVSLLRAPGPQMPMTWGILKPTILLPAEASGWAPQRLASVLLHEIAHLRRKDLITRMLGQFLTGLYWFNPFSWCVSKRMALEMERACDDMV